MSEPHLMTRPVVIKLAIVLLILHKEKIQKKTNKTSSQKEIKKNFSTPQELRLM